MGCGGSKNSNQGMIAKGYKKQKINTITGPGADLNSLLHYHNCKCALGVGVKTNAYGKGNVFEQVIKKDPTT